LGLPAEYAAKAMKTGYASKGKRNIVRKEWQDEHAVKGRLGKNA